MGGQRPVGEHGALRVARRPARVEELTHRVLVDGPRVETHRGCRRERGLVVGTDIESPLGPERVGKTGVQGMHDEQRGLAVIEDERELGRSHAHVERRQHATREHDAVVRLEHFHRVPTEVRDAVTRAAPQIAAQGVREAMCPLAKSP